MDKIHLYCLLFGCFIAFDVAAMTKEQMVKAAKMFKNSCVKKIQVPAEIVDEISQGKFIEDEKVMCYIACIYEAMNIVKNQKLNVQATIKQIDMMYPPEYKEGAKAAATACKDVQNKYNNICESSYWTAKCMYDFNPEAFIFA